MSNIYKTSKYKKLWKLWTHWQSTKSWGRLNLLRVASTFLSNCILLNGSKDQICPCHVTCDRSNLAKFGAQPDIQKCLWLIFFVVITQLEQTKIQSLCAWNFYNLGGGVIPIYPILYMYVTSKAKFVHCIDVIFCGIQPCWSDDWQVSTGGAEDQITTPFIPFMQVRYNTSS